MLLYLCRTPPSLAPLVAQDGYDPRMKLGRREWHALIDNMHEDMRASSRLGLDQPDARLVVDAFSSVQVGNDDRLPMVSMF